MSLVRWLGLVLAIVATHEARGQCVSLKLDTPLISDRYVDVAQFGDQLILANSHGLVFKDLNALAEPSLAVEPIPGEVVQITENKGLLLVTARDTGVYIYVYLGIEALPTRFAFYAIPNIQSAVLIGDHLFANVGDGVLFLRIDSRPKPQLIQKYDAPTRKIAADPSLLYIYREDGGVDILPYGTNGSFGPPKRLTLDGESVFYDFFLHGNDLVLDSLSGVRWVDLSPQGEILLHGFYHRNQGLDLVYDMAVEGNRLFLRFEERLDVYQINAGRSTQKTDSITLPFSEVGVTKIKPTPDYLHLLNIAPVSREWSLTSYQIENEQLKMAARLEENFDELSGAAIVKEHIYLSSNHGLYLATELENTRNLAALPLARRFSGPILQIAGSDSLLLVATAESGTPFSRVYAFEVDDGGGLAEVYSARVRGMVRDLTQFQDQFAFTQFYRSTQGDHYAAFAVSPDGAGGFETRALSRIVPLKGANPFSNLQIGELGLVYHDSGTIRIHPELARIENSFGLQFAENDSISRLLTAQKHLWVETGNGLALFKVLDQIIEEVGIYPHWFDLLLLSNNVVLAKSRLDRIPSRFHLLSRESDSFLHSQVAFSTSTEPIFISATMDDLVIAEKTSLSLYQFLCPALDNLYLLPFLPDLELEINSILEEKDVISMTIYNAENQIIGIQNLNNDLIEAFNGKKIQDWLFDFDALESPSSIVLNGSRPLSPVLSGFADETPRSRFAYQVPAWGGPNLYVPHIPKDLTYWDTNLFVRNLEGSTAGEIKLANAAGEELVKTFPPNSTRQIHLEDGMFEEPTSWARLSTDDLEEVLGGFSLLREPLSSQAASVPLISKLSDFLLVPHLWGRSFPHGWTGLVLANPNDKPVILRAIGYNPSGDLIFDHSFSIDTFASMVVIVEQWLKNFPEGEQVQWLALASERPIMGMMLLGNYGNRSLGGLSLSGSAGKSLIYPGIRMADTWRTSLIITNLDLRENHLQVVAYSGFGKVVSSSTRTLGSRVSLLTNVGELFPGLDEDKLGSIQTIRVQGTGFMVGFSVRDMEGTASLEAIEAYAEE